MGGLWCVNQLSSVFWEINARFISFICGLSAGDIIEIAVLGFYTLLMLGIFFQFFRYVVLIPLLLKFGVMQHEVLMTCSACGSYYGVKVTEVAHGEPSPCCEEHMNPPPPDCENGELYDKWGGER